MTVVITGGSGLLGQYLIDLLAEQNIDYKVLSRTNCDYQRDTLIAELSGAHALVHLAGSRRQHEHLLDYQDELLMLEHLLHASRINNVKHVVIASSISVYSGIAPFRETDRPNPKSLYGLNKLVIEHRARLFADKHKMRITCLRLSHMFGKNEENNYMINLFMRKAANNTPLIVHGDSSVKREFLYAKDAAHAILCSLQNKRAGFHLYNVAGLFSYTNLEVATIINRAFQNEGLFRENIETKDPFKPSFMNGEKIFNELGFTPNYTLEGAMNEIATEMREKHVPIWY